MRERREGGRERGDGDGVRERGGKMSKLMLVPEDWN